MLSPTEDKTSVSLPEGLATTGVRQIQSSIYGLYNTYLPSWWDWSLLASQRDQVMEQVTYRGKITTRIYKYLELRYGKMSETARNAIGNEIARWTTYAADVTYDITDDLNWWAGDFGDGGSCFWYPNRAHVRTMMSNYGGLAIRTYDEDRGSGRAWIMPIHSGWVLFNGYMSEPQMIKFAKVEAATWVFAMIVNHHTGIVPRRIQLRNLGKSSGLIYINSGCGYAFSQRATLPERIDLGVVSEHPCYRCGTMGVDLWRYDDVFKCANCIGH